MLHCVTLAKIEYFSFWLIGVKQSGTMFRYMLLVQKYEDLTIVLLFYHNYKRRTGTHNKSSESKNSIKVIDTGGKVYEIR